MNKKSFPIKNLLKPLPVLMFLAAGLRLVVSYILGSLIKPGEVCDDVLMFSYAGLESHFLKPNHYSMAKTMVFPLFLDMVSVSGIPYCICLSLLYIVAALVLFFTLKKVFQSKALAAFGYFYFLFIPLAFDAWCGLRVYRNAIVPPLALIFFALLVIAVWRSWFPEKMKKPGLFRSFLFYLLLGIVFTVNYYVREDGIWMLACLLVFLLAALIGAVIKNKADWKKIRYYLAAAFVLLPLLVFAGSTHLAKKVNEHFFGVYAIETRTTEEQGGFTKRLFMIDSENRSSTIWTPADVIDQAFEVSETLQSVPGYRDAIIGCQAAEGDMYQNPLVGERIQWVIKEALVICGAFEDEAASEALFKKVNAELDEAFRDGRLKKADRIQILSSSGGFTKEEVLDLKRELLSGFQCSVQEKGSAIGAPTPNVSERKAYSDITEFAAKLTNEKRLLDYETTTLTKGQTLINRGLIVLNKVYGYMNIILFMGGIVAVIWGFVRLFLLKKKDLANEILLWLGLCAFLGIGLVYLFGISWYSHFIWSDAPVNTVIFNFYLIALPVIWLFYYLFTVVMYARIFKKKEK